MAKPTNETEPSETSPSRVQDLRSTSDIRLVMIEVARVDERVKALTDANKDHKSDFRWTWTGLVAGFLVLAGLFIYGYNRLEDKFEIAVTTTTTATTKVDTKLDDLLQRLNSQIPLRR